MLSSRGRTPCVLERSQEYTDKATSANLPFARGDLTGHSPLIRPARRASYTINKIRCGLYDVEAVHYSRASPLSQTSAKLILSTLEQSYMPLNVVRSIAELYHLRVA